MADLEILWPHAAGLHRCNAAPGLQEAAVVHPKEEANGWHEPGGGCRAAASQDQPARLRSARLVLVSQLGIRMKLLRSSLEFRRSFASLPAAVSFRRSGLVFGCRPWTQSLHHSPTGCFMRTRLQLRSGLTSCPLCFTSWGQPWRTGAARCSASSFVYSLCCWLLCTGRALKTLKIYLGWVSHLFGSFLQAVCVWRLWHDGTAGPDPRRSLSDCCGRSFLWGVGNRCFFSSPPLQSETLCIYSLNTMKNLWKLDNF